MLAICAWMALLETLADLHDRDHRGDSNDDAQRRQDRPHHVAAHRVDGRPKSAIDHPHDAPSPTAVSDIPAIVDLAVGDVDRALGMLAYPRIVRHQ